MNVLFKSHLALVYFNIVIIPVFTCVPTDQPERYVTASDFVADSSTFESVSHSVVESTTIFNNATAETVASNNLTTVSTEETMTTADKDTNDATVERLSELRIHMVKLQILSKLKLREPPQLATKSSESSKEAIQILLKESEIQQKSVIPQGSEERLVIHAKNSAAKCTNHYASNFCKTFHFDVTADLNYSVTSLWIFRKDEKSSALLVTVYYSDAKEKKGYRKYHASVRGHGWNKVDFPVIEIPQILNGNIQCIVQIEGPTIEDQGERRPFLMVTKVSYTGTRQRRDTSCNTNESCCWRPLRVSFNAMRFDFVLYPEYLDINMCTGKCRMDHTEMRTHYERAMSQVLEKNSRLHDSLGRCWTLCCKPKQMDAVRVIYNDTDGIIHDHYIPELTVKSCTCN